MSTGNDLRDSFGPEVTPYQRIHPQPLEYANQIVAKSHEIVAAKPHETTEIEPPQHQSTHGEKRKILGLLPIHFALVAAILLIVLGAGIGVGVGIGLKQGSSSSSSSSSSGDNSTISPSSSSTIPSTTSSPTSESTTTPPNPIATSGTHGMAANSCNFTQPKVVPAQDESLFSLYCFTNWPPGGDGDDKVSDIGFATVYTFEDCIQKCVDFNIKNKNGKTGKKCAALTYGANLTDALEVKHLGANCWLKDKRGKSSGGGGAELGSAALAGPF